MRQDEAAGAGPVDGIVLAAGRSRRMGEPKPLLEVEGEAFVERAVRTLRAGGCRMVVAVVGGGTTSPEGRLADAAGAVVVLNDSPESEPVDSIVLGLDALPDDCAGAVILPVDHPLVHPATVSALVDAFRARGAPVVRPVYGGRPGHPGIFARALFDELRAPELPDGAQTVIAAHAASVLDVSVGDAGVVGNVDTPEDYERLVGD